ncbi:hypothetical protein ACJ8I6_13595, partial [Serratia sp. CY37646]|uniref:hypothetical protein n=1 Tax=Serratia sp. CY37646 TaxID=3383611 RepID=UPI003FA0533B
MKTLVELYEEHHGKSSDKWSIYLSSYHEVLSHLRFNPVKQDEFMFIKIAYYLLTLSSTLALSGCVS